MTRSQGRCDGSFRKQARVNSAWIKDEPCWEDEPPKAQSPALVSRASSVPPTTWRPHGMAPRNDPK